MSSAKTIEAHCPKCRRPRRVGIGTRSGQAAAAEVLGKDHRAWVSRWQVCATCKALESIDAHHAAICKLREFVTSRRARGL